MKAVILAGGLGTRLSEETDRIPKPMVTVGNKPILWHIMKLYSKYQISDFVICAGIRRTPSSSFCQLPPSQQCHRRPAANKVTCLNEAAEPGKSPSSTRAKAPKPAAVSSASANISTRLIRSA
jgi:molybdopterin-guanine dinucleotide biosynthesis protein A